MFLVVAAIFAPFIYAQTGRDIDPEHLPGAGQYVTPVAEGKAAWVVRGKSFTLDLTGRDLNGQGSNGGQQEKYAGIGLLIDGATDVTIKNLSVSGYRQNIVLRNCVNVKILGCKVSHSRAIRMGTDGKAVDTFLSLRDVAAWRTYGAGIWMEKCKGCRIDGCAATDAQNGIVMVESINSTLYNNDCSFNGGWGIALWNSSHNSLHWNHADFCNRPWSGGWGGDAAGVVLVNGSTANQMVANSMTHGGDGFFLSDRTNGGLNKQTGKYEIQGASNRNVIAFSDGSWSSNNAFEATFSKENSFYRNTATDSNYGFWLGFSGSTLVMETTISGNKSDGVAIPDGLGNLLFRNVIEKNGISGVHIWSDEGPALTDQPAASNSLIQNRIADCPKAIAEERAFGTEYQANTIERGTTPPDYVQKGVDFTIVTRLGSYAMNPEGRSATAVFNRRPANWLFYRDTSGPKGQDALKIGDYCPSRP